VYIVPFIIVFIYSAAKLPVCLNKLTYLLTLLMSNFASNSDRNPPLG